MEVVEPPSSQRQASFPVETKHVGHEAEGDLQTVENREEQGHGDAKMVEASTQTSKRKVKNKTSQTTVVVQRHQETQTKQDDASDAESAAESQLTADTLQDDNSAQTPPRKNEDSGASSHQEQNPRKEASPAAGRSADPTDCQTKTEAKPKSYATAVSGDSGGDTQSRAANKTPSRDRR